MTRVLIVNAGSSTLKWSVLEEHGAVVANDNQPWANSDLPSRRAEISSALQSAPAFDLVGHRIVHGGSRFSKSVAIDARIRQDLDDLEHLAPTHMPLSLAAVDIIAKIQPQTLQVAAFDTAFHATMPDAAAGYGVPFEWEERFGVRRFGFHGLSVAYAAQRAREMVGDLPPRLIVCHLGSGCSVTAVEKGRSVDTTMGFSPLEGLMMSTRSGSVDPGLLLYLQEHCDVGTRELRETLTSYSGILGVSGISGDLRRVVSAADRGSERARLAYERFVHSIRRAFGAMLVILGGLDAIVFTGGIGENSPRIRADVVAKMGVFGVSRNHIGTVLREEDYDEATAGSPVHLLVIRSREDLIILQETLQEAHRVQCMGDIHS